MHKIFFKKRAVAPLGEPPLNGKCSIWRADNKAVPYLLTIFLVVIPLSVMTRAK